MEVVDIWTGRRACALQSALRMSNDAFARHLGVSVRTVASWHDNPDLQPRPEIQASLDTVLESASAGVLARFRTFLAEEPQVQAEVRSGNDGATNDADSATSLIVAIAVVVTDQHVLLVCRRDAEPSGITWQFPAGIVKPGTSGATVAVRETLAETGVHCSVREELGRRIHPLSGLKCEYFLCDYLTGEVENRDPSENVSVVWASRAEVARFISADTIFPPILRALEETNDAASS